VSDHARDLIFAVIAFALALTVGVTAFGYPVGSSYFPRTLAVLMGGLALLFGLRTWRSRSDARTQVGGLVAPLATFASIALYVLAVGLVGFEIATFVFLMTSMLVLGRPRRPLLFAAVALAITGGLHVVFFVLLGVSAPDSLLF